MIFQIDQLTKAYGIKPLFSSISASWTDQDRIGLIGVNGTGKSTFLKILAEKAQAESGALIFPKGARVIYLAQAPEFDPKMTVLEAIFEGDEPIVRLIKAYETALAATETQQHAIELEKLTETMTQMDAWAYEREVKGILFQLGISDLSALMGNLSGGMLKRVALAKCLVLPADLLLLDEPTNHLDADAVEWLETYLAQRKGALMMITHDRYFLDRVVNRIFEIDKGKLYTYPGHYTSFLEAKEERLRLESQEQTKLNRLFQQELAWMRQGVEARRTKQEARKQRFYALEERMDKGGDSGGLKVDVTTQRLGKTTVDLEDVTVGYHESSPLISGLSYSLLRNDRLGIVGPNGVGKSTLVKVMIGALAPLSGQVRIGQTVRVGYFRQEVDHLPEQVRVIDYVKDIAELSKTQSGYVLTASQMLERFLFDGNMQWSFIGKLSGGERRRLYLLGVLMSQPNILVLDEPTNDLDITTLGVLEGYLDEFPGAVIVVSHDRYFMDRTCDRIFAIASKRANLYVGDYSDYREKQIEEVEAKRTQEKKLDTKVSSNTETQQRQTTSSEGGVRKGRLSFNEQREYDQLPDIMAGLEANLERIQHDMQVASNDYVALTALVSEKDLAEMELLEAMERYEALEARLKG